MEMKSNNNMISLRYSVVLRTLGRGGEAYRALLKSIREQTIQPSEFIVVMPFGTMLPEDRIGTERFIFSEKGMVTQRVAGLREATQDYVLIIDDDIEFAPTLVSDLFMYMRKAQADGVIPELSDASAGSKTFLGMMRAFLSSGARISHRRSEYALRIGMQGGTIRQVPLYEDHVYYTQTGHGACCLMKKTAALFLRFEDEVWLEKNARYAYPDDQVFFYKAHLLGVRIAYACGITFRHLDARSSMMDVASLQEKRCTLKHNSFRNLAIFWHRFLFNVPSIGICQKTVRIVNMCWCVFFVLTTQILLHVWRPSHWKELACAFRAYKDAYLFIRSDCYI